jgi:hypothetical protein
MHNKRKPGPSSLRAVILIWNPRLRMRSFFLVFICLRQLYFCSLCGGINAQGYSQMRIQLRDRCTSFEGTIPASHFHFSAYEMKCQFLFVEINPGIYILIVPKSKENNPRMLAEGVCSKKCFQIGWNHSFGQEKWAASSQTQIIQRKKFKGRTWICS